MKNKAISINKPNIIYAACILTSLYFVFFSPLLKNVSMFIAGLAVLVMFATLIMLSLRKSKVIVTKKNVGLWILLVFFFCSLINTRSFEQSINYIFFYIVSLMLLNLLVNSTKWFLMAWRTIFIFTVFHALVTMLSFFNTGIYVELFFPLMREEAQRFALLYINEFQFYSGIAGQTGTNAFYMSIGVALSLSKIFYERTNNKGIYIFFIIIFLFSIMLSGKRGLLLANTLALFILLLISTQGSKRNKYYKVIKRLFVPLVAAIVLYIAYNLIPSVNLALSRFSISGGTLDISSGRFDLFKSAWKIFLENPVIGVGINAFTYSTSNYGYNIGAHNDWLQFAAEIGLFGTIFMIYLVLKILSQTIKLIKVNDNLFSPFIYVSIYVQIVVLFYSLVGMPFHNFGMLLSYIIFIAIPFAVEKINNDLLINGKNPWRRKNENRNNNLS